MPASNDLGQWYYSIPPITRAWFTGSVIVPVAVALNIVNQARLLLYVCPIVKYFEVCFS